MVKKTVLIIINWQGRIGRDVNGSIDVNSAILSFLPVPIVEDMHTSVRFPTYKLGNTLYFGSVREKTDIASA